MRTIKFRAWDNENNQMLDVQELNFEDCFYGGEMQIKTTMYNDYFDCREMPLMQYTGLHDKNGKEMYEGDIVFIKGDTELLDIKGKIEYSDTFVQFIITNTGNIINEAEPLRDYEDKDIEVIGNVFENKELLNETNR